MVPKDLHIEKIDIDKVDHLTVEQGPLPEDHSKEDTVDQVPDCPPRDKSEREADNERLFTDLVQVVENSTGGDDRKQGEEQLPPHIDAERHTGIFDEGQAKKIAEDRIARPQRHAGVV